MRLRGNGDGATTFRGDCEGPCTALCLWQGLDYPATASAQYLDTSRNRGNTVDTRLTCEQGWHEFRARTNEIHPKDHLPVPSSLEHECNCIEIRLLSCTQCYLKCDPHFDACISTGSLSAAIHTWRCTSWWGRLHERCDPSPVQRRGKPQQPTVRLRTLGCTHSDLAVPRGS